MVAIASSITWEGWYLKLSNWWIKCAHSLRKIIPNYKWIFKRSINDGQSNKITTKYTKEIYSRKILQNNLNNFSW